MRRKYVSKILLAGVAVSALALAGCGNNTSNNSSTSTGSSSGKVVHLRYMVWDPNEEVGYTKSIKEFEKLHPNIKVTVEQYSWSDYWHKLLTEMAAGDAPDVFWDHVSYFPQLVSSGELLNLSPYIQKDNVKLSGYYKSLVNQYQYKGNYYGLPKDWDTIALLYNKTEFEKLGIQMPKNLTWNPQNGGSFLQLAEKLTIDKNGKNATQPGFNPKQIKQYGYLSWNKSQEGYLNFIAENGGKFLDKKFGTKLQYDSPNAVQALQFMQNLIYKYHVSPPGSQTEGATSDQTFFDSGKVAMTIEGDWMLAPIAKGANFKIGVAELPIGPAGRVSVMNGLSDAIYAHTKHPKQAWELVKWLAGKKSENLLTSGGWVWSPRPSQDNNFIAYWKKKGINVTPFMNEAKGQTVSYPITYGWNEAYTKIHNTMNLMYLNQLSAQQAAEEAVKEADAAFQSAAQGK